MTCFPSNELYSPQEFRGFWLTETLFVVRNILLTLQSISASICATIITAINAIIVLLVLLLFVVLYSTTRKCICQKSIQNNFSFFWLSFELNITFNNSNFKSNLMKINHFNVINLCNIYNYINIISPLIIENLRYNTQFWSVCK